jgi:hypothetical protein
MRRTWFRRTAAVVLALLALWIGLFVWGRVSRTSALRSYETKLFDAARPFFQNIETGPTSMQQIVANFRDGKITSADLATAAAKWESDFNTTGSAVSKLKPPRELRDAQTTFLSALHEYVGVARFYVVVQKQRQLEDAVPKANKKATEDQVQLLLQHISDMQSRADALYTSVVTAVNDLAGKWGVKAKTPLPAAPGVVPPPATQGAPGGSGITPVPS